MAKLNKFLLLFLLISFQSCFTNANIPRVPDWAKDAVWYQIFPDRFNNGDIGNDPEPKDMVGAWPYQVTKGWEPHPWTSDWYKLQSWEENGKGFYWNVQNRRYGGDLQGVIDKLDYLQDLGITAIYFNPLFESPSLHKYDATFYHHIDNNFGPNPKKDAAIWNEENPEDPSTWQWTTADQLFLMLIKKAHKRNIKIIIDGVFNHTGRTFWAFQDIVKSQANSKYTNWYYIKSFDDSLTKENEFNYEGWYGAMDLPEIREDENGLVPAAANHIHSIVKRWMDPNRDGDPSDGIDGWRLDVADMVKHQFWQKFRTWVKDINPEAFITGEIWWADWKTNKMMNAEPWLRGDQFDAVMNYRFTRSVKNLVSDQDSAITNIEFRDSINYLREDYNNENNLVLMNLLGSHDTERLASMIVNPDHWYDHNGNPAQRNSFKVRKPNRTERIKQKLMIGIQMTMPGAPMIYYGDEAGMWGGDDPDCRKPMIWPKLNYEFETTHPFGLERPSDSVNFDSSLFKWYKLLISIRNNNIELRRGELNFIGDQPEKILLYKRELGTNRIYVLLNNSDNSREIDIENLTENYKNLITGEYISANPSGVKIKLKPYQIVILK